MDITTAMLADAATEANGKLYIHGGGWDRIITAQLPFVQSTFALVLVFRVEWNETNDEIPILIELVDADNQPAGLRGAGTLQVGRPPTARAGDPAYSSHITTISGLKFGQAGPYQFRVSSGERELTTLWFRVVHQPIPTVPSG
jgi:hypothetical protein